MLIQKPSPDGSGILFCVAIAKLGDGNTKKI
jgi:hypothetical protein